MALITCRNLALGYGKQRVIDRLSFSLEAGERLAVVGENGSGKSTLMRALGGLCRPQSGEILYAEGVREGCGYLPQKAPQSEYFPATVREVVASGVRRTSLFLSRGQKEKIAEALELFGMEDAADKGISSLSGGQRQRMLLARAFVAAERLLLLDEPVTGLDPLITHELYHRIRTLSRSGLGVVLVSHDVKGALGFCTHVLHLVPGADAVFATAEEYRKSALFAAFAEEKSHA